MALFQSDATIDVNLLQATTYQTVLSSSWPASRAYALPQPQHSFSLPGVSINLGSRFIAVNCKTNSPSFPLEDRGKAETGPRPGMLHIPKPSQIPDSDSGFRSDMIHCSTGHECKSYVGTRAPVGLLHHAHASLISMDGSYHFEFIPRFPVI
jgi:hypothetical protein